MYNYFKPLKKENVLVDIFIENKNSVYGKNIISGIKEVSDKYNFLFRVISSIDIEEITKNHDISIVVKLLIIVHDVSNTGFNTNVTNKTLRLLDNNLYTNISIAFSYLKKENESALKKIEYYKYLSKDKINFLRPILFKNIYKVPEYKIIENSICDSVRIKYYPIKLSNEIKIEPSEIKFFKEAETLIKSYKLFHRSKTDGYVSIRRKNGGFLVTSTKTDKTNILMEKISLVHKYSKHSNELYYSGKFLPSSDSVELSIIYEKIENINTVIHIHASDLFTRNKKYINKVLVDISPYGEVVTGEKIVKSLNSVNDMFIIMEEHGEIFASEKFEVSKNMKKILKKEYSKNTLHKQS